MKGFVTRNKFIEGATTRMRQSSTKTETGLKETKKVQNKQKSIRTSVLR